MQTTILNINGMTCIRCVNSIKNVIEKVSGVRGADVSLENKQVKIKYDPEKTNINQFKEAIVGAGFEINI